MYVCVNSPNIGSDGNSCFQPSLLALLLSEGKGGGGRDQVGGEAEDATHTTGEILGLYYYRNRILGSSQWAEAGASWYPAPPAGGGSLWVW